MATFVISNLDAQDFTFENIVFKKLVNDNRYIIELRDQWQRDYNATFTAVADDNLVVAPIIKNRGLLGVVDDICLLLSLAQSRCIYCPEHTINQITDATRLFRGSKKISDKIIEDNQIESYLSAAVRTLREPEWIEKTGFIPSIYFLMGGNYPELGGVEFVLTWIALEILANTYSKTHGISNILTTTEFKEFKKAINEILNRLEKANNLSSKQKELIIQKIPELNHSSIHYKVSKLTNEYEWDFITDNLFSDWKKLRNRIMHEGTYAGLDQPRLINLSTRLKIAVQLALIDLLGCSDYIDNLQGLKIQIKG